ncbi:MAG: DUF1905 domain-containing protein [Gemmatimonadota bacterium]|nr:DUF1905 domain-containing protein [Gemmatimonadota bacterium]
MAHRYGGTFKAKLFKYAGPGGWHFAPVPKKYAPPVTHGWGRTPVTATVDGHEWETSVWWDSKSKRTLLAVPKKVRGAKGDGDTVTVRITFSTV